MVGPRSLGVCLLTAAFVGMVFTIQFIRWVDGWVGGRVGGACLIAVIDCKLLPPPFLTCAGNLQSWG